MILPGIHSGRIGSLRVDQAYQKDYPTVLFGISTRKNTWMQYSGVAIFLLSLILFEFQSPLNMAASTLKNDICDHLNTDIQISPCTRNIGKRAFDRAQYMLIRFKRSL